MPVKGIEQSNGQAAAARLSFNPLLFAVQSMDNTQEAWDRLDTDEARTAMLDAFFEKLEHLFAKNWAAIYQMISICRDYKQYWRNAGFDSFEDFWKERGAFAFEQFAALENAYHYAKTVCPKLFDLSLPEARRIMAEFSQIARPRKSRRQSGSSTKNGQALLVGIDLDATSSEYRRGYKDGRSAGSSGHRTRFARLKRDHPRIAATVLKGAYLVRQKNGRWKIDLIQAEKDAGVYQRPSSQNRNRIDKVAAAYRKLNKTQRAEFRRRLRLGYR